MNFSLSSEQTMLRDTAKRFVEKHSASYTSGFDPELWQEVAQLGWLALPFPQTHGGLGGSPIDVMILMEELGRGLLLEPYLSQSLAGELALADEALLKGIIDGTSPVAVGLYESQSRYELAQVSTTAKLCEQAYELSGTKTCVLNGAAAGQFIISARTQGSVNDADGISLFVVDKTADGLNIDDYQTFDGLNAATVTLNNVQVKKQACLALNNALPLIETAVEKAIVALAAQALGAMEVLLNTTVDYCKLRQQFGKKISQFQSVQHRLVDMYIACEELRSLLYSAAIKLAENADDSAESIAVLKVKVGEAGRFVGEQAVQLHGAMGFTDELPVGHFYKRLIAMDALFGNSDFHLQRFIKMSQ